MTVDLGTLAELVRAPAALTVPGDTAAGGAVSPGLALSSVCLYWAGMALNDYADRDLDAEERPERPIPSGRVRPGQALGLAAGLTATGLFLAARTGGRGALGVATGLAAVVWAYDLVLKDTAAGPLAMAAARGLDVFLGGTVPASPRSGVLPGTSAGRRVPPGSGRARLLAAGAVAAHTYGVTALSRGEVSGGSTARSAAALTATALAAGLAAVHVSSAIAPAGAQPAVTAGKLAALGLVGAYAGLVGRAQLAAARTPDAGRTRTAVGQSILGLLPLQAALTAGRGHLATAVALAVAHPLARRLSRKVSPT
ncbi:SCO3242 family prenyltransferase [Sphaerisporangium perillae]|uniref:SCO3242 family prenyltransferase n=1 Tax=Sphaerisporangium perillae TaxID=2935860 RepID=UPI0020104208|nr:UbiA family prenyltransferase [Sphaerisporangium perillae]